MDNIINITDKNFPTKKHMLIFCERIAKRICGKWKQHAIIVISGSTGTGKSYTAIEIAIEISIAISRIIGGKPEDYFTLDRVGIINSSEILRIMDKMNDKYSINILDDIGVGLNARKWQSKENIIINDIVQTFRINCNVLILTVPEGNLIDKAVRERAHYIIEMQTPMYNLNLTVSKIKEPHIVANKNKIYNHYIQDEDNCKIKRNLFSKPPEDICNEYDKRRDEQFKIMYEDRKKKYSEIQNVEIPKIQKKTKKDLIKEILLKKAEGFYGDITDKAICKQEGVDYQYYQNNK